MEACPGTQVLIHTEMPACKRSQFPDGFIEGEKTPVDQLLALLFDLAQFPIKKRFVWLLKGLCELMALP